MHTFGAKYVSTGCCKLRDLNLAIHYVSNTAFRPCRAILQDMTLDYTKKGLDPLTEYEFKVQSYNNSINKGESAQITATTGQSGS